MKISFKTIFFFLFLIIVFSIISFRLLEIESKKINQTALSKAKIKVYLNQHPYSEAIIREIPLFEKKTGIKVEYTVSEEDIYRDKLYHILKNKQQDLDVFMAGPYSIWKYSYEGLLEDLDEYINDNTFTDENYDLEDFLPVTLKTLRWNLNPGDRYGSGPLFGIPLGFELTSIPYNKKLVNEKDLDSLKTIDDLINLCNKLKNKHPNINPIGLRGKNHWSSISGGYINLYYSSGLSDFKKINQILVPDVNSKPSVEFNKKYMKMIKRYIGKDWENYSWYNIGSKLGSGKIAFLVDADNNGYLQNLSELSSEKGNISVYPISKFKLNNKKTNIWVWGLSMNRFSEEKEASWEFIRYFTAKEFLKKAIKQQTYLNVPRKSILFSKEFSENNPHIDFLKKEIENVELLMTPNPYAVDIMNDWMNILNRMYKDELSVETGLDELSLKMEEYLKKIEIKRSFNEESAYSR